jgi:hypothetical protein
VQVKWVPVMKRGRNNAHLTEKVYIVEEVNLPKSTHKLLSFSQKMLSSQEVYTGDILLYKYL